MPLIQDFGSGHAKPSNLKFSIIFKKVIIIRKVSEVRVRKNVKLVSQKPLKI